MPMPQMIPMIPPMDIKKPVSAGYELFGSNEVPTEHTNVVLMDELLSLGLVSSVTLLPTTCPTFLIDKVTKQLVNSGRVLLPMMSDGKFDPTRSEKIIDSTDNKIRVSLKSFEYKTKEDLISLLNSTTDNIFIMDFELKDSGVVRVYFVDESHSSNQPIESKPSIELKMVDGEYKLITIDE